MKIISISKSDYWNVETEEAQYTRYSKDCWTETMGESEENIYYPEDQEKAFNEFMILNSEKIKWKEIYYPIGEWIDVFERKVEIEGNFKCIINGIDAICIMNKITTPLGHGESSISSFIPKFYDYETLKEIENVEFVIK